MLGRESCAVLTRQQEGSKIVLLRPHSHCEGALAVTPAISG
jgi:hypothetical protein